MKEKIINICGKEVKIIYCAATENSFEEFSGKSIGVFVPDFEEKDGKTIITAPAQATIGDWVMLGFAGIIAAATRDKVEMPITSEELLYNAKPVERNALIAAIQELRNDWYGIPKVVEELLDKEKQQNDDNSEEEGDEKPKN